MLVNSVNIQNKTNFNGNFKLNPKNMDRFDIELFENNQDCFVNFAKKQKYDYTVSKFIGKIFVSLEENGKKLDEYAVNNYPEKDGQRSIRNVIKTIRNMTEDRILKSKSS